MPLLKILGWGCELFVLSRRELHFGEIGLNHVYHVRMGGDKYIQCCLLGQG